MEWYMEVLKKYAQFSGRSRRKEYWSFALINTVIGVVFGVAVGATTLAANRDGGVPMLATFAMGLLFLYSLAICIPGLAVSVRRLHDTGKSGLFLLICLVPFIGSIIVLIFMLQDSQPGPNLYGPNPKELPGGVQFASAYPRF